MRGTRCRCLAAGLAIGLALSWAGPASAQPGQVPSPSVQPINQSADPILKAFKWRSIGPANMGGRIDDIEVVEGDTFTQYVGFATGGLWKTVNNGTTWTPIFDTYAVSSIGDIAIAKSDPNLIWVGTGEANNRQSSSFGDGIYKSTDGGKTFTHMGLKDSQSIARVVVHPRNPNIVYVAVMGHLFGPNRERGLFKTTDGGKTWTNTKFIDEDTGFTEVVMHPANPEILFAASYQRRRVAVGLQWRRSRQRPLEDDRRRQELEEARGGRAAGGSARPDRRHHLPDEAQRDVRADRSRGQRRNRRWRRRRRQANCARPAARAAAAAGAGPGAASSRSRPRAASGGPTTVARAGGS